MGSRVCERDMFVYEGDESPTITSCAVVSECCIFRKLWCIVSGLEFGFLDEGNVCVMFFKCVCEFVYFVCDPIDVQLYNV